MPDKDVKDREKYNNDIIAAMAERIIKRLWILIIVLVVLLFGSNAAWIVYESQFETVTITQDVEQEAEDGVNHFVGGDYYGTSEGENNR